MEKYQRPKQIRREYRNLGGKFKGGKLAPIMAVPIYGSETGILNQNVVMELDPIAGRMVTEITAGVVSLFVPVTAIDALKNPAQDYPGSADVIRAKLMSGTPLFDLEAEGEISKRCGVNPRSISGVKSVSEIVRIGHNAAVNFLRQRKYVNATLLLANSTAMTPALISNTVLDRLNGVLDPEDRVNGKIDFTGQIPVKGIGLLGSNLASTTAAALWSGDGVATTSSKTAKNSGYTHFEVDGAGIPQIWADLAGADGISLTDFYRAEKMDQLTRVMRRLVDENPQYGEELAVRWSLGLSMDIGAQPIVLYEREETFGTQYRRGMDGAGLDTARTDAGHRVSFAVPVPRTEFGGIIYTFAYVKPDETLASQPHPILSEPWGAINFVADEMALDPVPVTVRDLDADCLQADEGNVALYVGHNHLKKEYVNYGWNRHLDKSTVEAKTAIWQLEVPMSVTPDSVIYPETLDQYPFVDQLAEICRYQIESSVSFATPLQFGPVPVEELAVIETADIFEDLP